MAHTPKDSTVRDKQDDTVNLRSNKSVFVNGATIDALVLIRALVALAVVICNAELRVLTGGVAVASMVEGREGHRGCDEKEKERSGEHLCVIVVVHWGCKWVANGDWCSDG
jgi:hypothetical protein